MNTISRATLAIISMLAMVLVGTNAMAQDSLKVEATFNLSPCIEGMIVEEGKPFIPTLITDSIVQGAFTRHIQVKANCGGMHDLSVLAVGDALDVRFKQGGKMTYTPEGDAAEVGSGYVDIAVMECDCCYTLSVTLKENVWMKVKHLQVNGEAVSGFPEE